MLPGAQSAGIDPAAWFTAPRRSHPSTVQYAFPSEKRKCATDQISDGHANLGQAKLDNLSVHTRDWRDGRLGRNPTKLICTKAEHSAAKTLAGLKLTQYRLTVVISTTARLHMISCLGIARRHRPEAAHSRTPFLSPSPGKRSAGTSILTSAIGT